MDKSQRGPSGWNQGNREDDSGKPQYAAKALTRKKMNKKAAKALDNAFRSLNEAKATYCGRCGTTHVPPSKGGTCPALKEEVDYDRHFSRQSKEVQTKINHHLRQGADYPTAARKAGATALKVGKMNEGVVASARNVGGRAVKYGPDAATVATGNVSSGTVGTTQAIESGLSKGAKVAQATGRVRTAKALNIGAGAARLGGAQDVVNAAGRAATRFVPKAGSTIGTAAKGILGKAALPVAAGLAVYDAYKGYNSNPRASTSQKLKNAGINALSGLTFGLSKFATGEMKESTTHGNGKMKTLTQFMAEANANRYVEEQEELSPEMQAIFDAINEAVGDRELSEEEFNEIFNYVVENLESEAESDELAEAHDVELKPHPNKKGTHYVVHKVNDKSIGSDQLKAGETLSDTHVDDLKDMGYSVKIHD